MNKAFCVFFLCVAVFAGDPPEQGSGDILQKWTNELASDDYVTREFAMAGLKSAGRRAVPYVAAALETEDPEALWRARKIFNESSNSVKELIELERKRRLVTRISKAKALQWVSDLNSADRDIREQAMRNLEQGFFLVLPELSRVWRSGTPAEKEFIDKLQKILPPERVTERFGNKVLELAAASPQAKQLCEMAAHLRSHLTKTDREQLVRIEEELSGLPPLSVRMTEEQSKARDEFVTSRFDQRRKILDGAVDRFQDAPIPQKKDSLFDLSSYVSRRSSSRLAGRNFIRENMHFTRGKSNYSLTLQNFVVLEEDYKADFLMGREDAGWVGTFATQIDVPFEPSAVMDKVHFFKKDLEPLNIRTSDLLEDPTVTALQYRLPSGELLNDPLDIRKTLKGKHAALPESLPVELGVSFSASDQKCQLLVGVRRPGEEDFTFRSSPSTIGEEWFRKATGEVVVLQRPISQRVVSVPMPEVPAPKKQGLVFEISGPGILASPIKPWMILTPKKGSH